MENRYPSDWNSRRQNVYRRDGYTCQNCGVQGGSYGNAELHAHHNVPISKGGSHQLTNLTTLCKGCHDAIHHKHKIAPTGYSAPAPSIDWSDVPKPSATTFLKFCAWAAVFVLLAAATGPAVIITFPILYHGFKKSDGTLGFRDPRKAFDFEDEEETEETVGEDESDSVSETGSYPAHSDVNADDSSEIEEVEQTDTDQNPPFDWYEDEKVPVGDVLDYLDTDLDSQTREYIEIVVENHRRQGEPVDAADIRWIAEASEELDLEGEHPFGA